jgi:hypothetical protein
MYPQHCEWLRFRWNRKNFKFVSLLFGLSSAPWAFIEILRPTIAHLRSLGIRLVIYSDDILIVHSFEAGTRKDGRIVKRLLVSLGFSINSSTRPDDEIHWVNYPLLLNVVKKFYRVEKNVQHGLLCPIVRK